MHASVTLCVSFNDIQTKKERSRTNHIRTTQIDVVMEAKEEEGDKSDKSDDEDWGGSSSDSGAGGWKKKKTAAKKQAPWVLKN